MQNRIFKGGSHAILRQISQYSLEKPHHCRCHPSGGIWFFNLGWYLFAFLWLVALWILIIATTVAFYRISKPAAWLMLPYLVWVAFAGYLNLGVWLLNR